MESSVPLNAEAIAFTEKKMDMTLDDIIKMSKKKTSKGKRPPRQPIKKRPFQNGRNSQGNAKVQQFMESRSAIRQGVLAQRRSNFVGGNQFPVISQAAKRAAPMQMRNRAIKRNKPSIASSQRKPVHTAFQNGKGKEMLNQKPRTMDALFAHMQEQRMRTIPQQQANVSSARQFVPQRRFQQRQGRGPAGRNNATNHYN